MSTIRNETKTQACTRNVPQQLDLFSAATLPQTPSHGGYPSTSTGTNGASTSGATIAASATAPAYSYSYMAPAPSWTTITLGPEGAFTMSSDSKIMTEEIPEYSFMFRENSVDRKAVFAPEYDMTPLESVRMIRLMYSAPNNLDKLAYVKNNGLLRHFRLE